MTQPALAHDCANCPAHHLGNLVRLGVDMSDWDYVVALAGNPNTGKSTVFNALTGLRQHTGNWPGKTVTRAEGGFEYGGDRYKLVDLPGTYSLLSSSLDEGNRPRLHSLRPTGRDRDRRRCDAPGAEPEPGASGAGDHGPCGRLPQPDGRGAPQGADGRRAAPGAGSRRAGRGDGGAIRRGTRGTEPGRRGGGDGFLPLPAAACRWPIPGAERGDPPVVRSDPGRVSHAAESAVGRSPAARRRPHPGHGGGERIAGGTR